MPRRQKEQERRARARKQQPEFQSRASSYVNVIAYGETMAQAYEANRDGLSDRRRLIFEYYSRPDIQEAMFRYAQGRKITVLRTFRPLYNRIEAPEDILYLALYHSEEKGLWPSFHGMITRYIEAQNLHICDFVIEIDYKRSWSACFSATRPYIEALRDFGVFARIKFSGHVSAHVIIPGETFPPDVGDVRRLLMDYAQKIVGHSDRLDRYFLQNSHFLRLPYSLNERTGLVSLPIMMDAFEKFGWRDAQPQNVETIEDWFQPPPENAAERLREFIKFAERQYHLIRQEEAAERLRKLKERERRAALGRGDEKFAALPHAVEPLMTGEAYQKMLAAAQEEWSWCEATLEDEPLRAALLELRDSGGVISLEPLAAQPCPERSRGNSRPLNDLWRVWKWIAHLPALEYYADQEVQEAIFRACESRRVRLCEEETQFYLQNPEDVYPLAIFHHRLLGVNEYPAFLASVARYEPDFQAPIGYDMVIEVDGRGREPSAAEIAGEVGRALTSQGLKVTAYHAGMPCIYLWVETPRADATPVDEISQRYAAIADEIRKTMRQAGFAHEQWRALKSDEFAPAPHSLNLYTGKPCSIANF